MIRLSLICLLWGIAALSFASCSTSENREILFSSASGPIVDPNTVFNLFAMQPDGSDLHQLTQSSADRRESNFPVLSPDGTRIAYLVVPSGPNKHDEIHIINASWESDPLVVRIDSLNLGYPEWSPDSKQLAFIGMGPNDRPDRLSWVYTVNADGSNIRRMSDSVMANACAGWLPTGDALLVSEVNQSESKILRMDIPSGDTELLVESDTLQMLCPVPAPDGSTVLFTGISLSTDINAPGVESMTIYRMNPNGTDIQLFVDIKGFSKNPRWSADGRYVVFHGSDLQNFFDLSPAASADSIEIFSVEHSGDNLLRLTYNKHADVHAAW